MAKDTTFVFRDDGNFAIRAGKVISSDEDLDRLEKIAETEEEFEPDTDKKAPKRRQSDDPDYDEAEQQEAEKNSSYIITPNGLRGKILGKVQDVWGEKITVRFENGRIAHLDVVDSLQYETVKTAKTEDPIEELAKRLSGPANDLETRSEELTRIIDQGSAMVRTASNQDSARLNQIVVTAEVEKQSVTEALAYMASDKAQAYEPPAPFRMQAVEQESMGGGSGSWLDAVTQDMVNEAANTDFESLMDEGPELYVSELGSGELAEGATVRAGATRFIQSKTAGVLDDALRQQYEDTFLARVEGARRDEQKQRKETIHKEAATQEEQVPELPDDFLW